MSLVIAKIIDGRIIIKSDSQLNNPNILKQNPTSTVLKVIVVSPTITVCFAGGVEFAHKAVREVFNKLKEVPDTPPIEIGLILKAYSEHDGQVDFILAVSEMSQSRLYKISDGLVITEMTSAWIGEHEGFALFQSLYIANQSHDLSHKAKCGHFSKAFKGVVSSRKIPSIDGFQIGIASSNINGKFKYSISGEIATPAQSVSADAEIQMVFGDSASGGYAVSQFATSEHDTPALAIHFSQLEMGILYIPSRSLDAIRIDKLNGLDFIEEVYQQYGIELQGLLIDLGHDKIINIGNVDFNYELAHSSDEPVVVTMNRTSGKGHQRGAQGKDQG